MPFHNIWSPNIGTSILQSVLRQAGFECDIYYANIEFAKITQLDFAEITHASYLLSNDILFAHLLDNAQEIPFGDNELFENIKKHTGEFIEKIAIEITKRKYDLIGFSLIFQTVPALVLAKRLKEMDPDIKIITGGSNCEGEMGLALHRNFPWIDYVSRGEGENLLLKLVNHLSGNEINIDSIPGLIHRKGKELIINKQNNNNLQDLNLIPTLNFDDWKTQLINNGFDFSSDRCILPLETSRGCWYGDIQQCIFCGLSGENLKFRTKAPRKAFEEINFYQNSYGVNNFFTTDLIFPNEYSDTLLPQLAENKENKPSIIYEVKATVSKTLLRKLKEAGVNTIQPGLETLSSEMLKIMRKSTKSYQNIRVLKWAFELGLTTVWNILYGLPDEKPEEYEKMAQLIPFLTHLQPPLFGIFPIVLQRFSPLYNEIIAKNNVEIKPLADYYKMYNLPESELKKLAYYFVNPENEGKNFDYVSPLKQKLWEWYKEIGKSVFISINDKSSLYFFDSRPIAKKETRKLKGLKKKIYLACDQGISLKSLIDKFDTGEEKLVGILNKFIKNALMIYIDDKYLSLAVSMDEYFHQNADIETNLTICASIYRTQMNKKCNSLKKVGERNLKSVIENIES